ncbi:MAG: hypothetical protein ACLUQ6_04385 [Alistipes onderdonkii]
MKKELLTLFCVAGISFPALGGTYNIAPKARATASSSLNADGDASKVNDGYIRLDNAGEWVSAAQMPYWQQLPYPLDPARLGRGGHPLAHRPLRPADGRCAYGRRRPLFQRRYTYRSSRDPGQRGAQGRGISRPNWVRWVKFEVNDAVGSHVGLSEIEAFPPAGAGGDFVSQVNPFIETTKGRYFFFITGNQPFGMIGAAPLTRNRNQYGGGCATTIRPRCSASRRYTTGCWPGLRSCRRPAASIPPSAKGTEIALPARGRNRPAGIATASSWRITASGSSRRPLTAQGSTA